MTGLNRRHLTAAMALFAITVSILPTAFGDTTTSPSRAFGVGHTGPVTSVAFSPDGEMSLTGSADTTAKLWDVDSGTEILSFVGHSDGVTSVAGLVFAGYLFNQTGSMPTALWSFFLVQSVFVVIPPRFPKKSGLPSEIETEGVDPFVHGQRQAEAALERIVQIGE